MSAFEELHQGSRKREQDGEHCLSKRPRLEDDRLAQQQGGSNIIEVEGKSCSHEVAWPPNQEGPTGPPPKREGEPARSYPFPIDPFQQTAVNALETGEQQIEI